MTKIISICSIFGSYGFFTIASMLGYVYGGVENSKIYMIYTVLIASTSICIFLYDCIKRDRKIKIYLIYIPILVITIYLIEFLKGSISYTSTRTLIYYLLWSLPAFFIGIYLSYDNRFKYVIKSLDIIMLIVAYVSIKSTLLVVLKGNYTQGLAGGTNQSLTYIAAFGFGLNLILNFNKYEYERFKFTTSNIYTYLCSMIMPLQFLSVIIPGGRGGAVLSLVYIIILICRPKGRIDKKNKGLLIVIFIISMIVFSFSINNEIVRSGFDRAFDYIGSGSIDWSGTSNRDSVYKKAIELIKDRPIVGYGLFGYLSYYDNPHNFILEILLNGGIIYLYIIVWILIIIAKKYLTITKYDKSIQLIGIIVVFPIVMLMFSGTYIISSQLWFFLGYVLSIENTIIKNKL